MKKKNIKSKELGIRNIVEFPSGAALLMIEGYKAEEALKRIKDAGLQQKLALNVQD